VSRLYPGVSTYTQLDAMLADPTVDAVVVATPVSTHFDLALAALRAGKHVLVEKPITTTSVEARRLIEEAQQRGLTLMVDHTFVYTSAVRKIHELIAGGALGRLLYYDSVRVNLGLFQHDVSVLWDLAVHDLSIMEFLIGAAPVQVAATGISHVGGAPENIAYLTCYFEDDLLAHFHVNWLAPVKVRQTMICGTEKMIVYDDIEASEKVKVYDKGVTFDTEGELYQVKVGYRTGDMWAPRIDAVEALGVEAAHFIECIRTGAKPDTPGEAGLQVVSILEAASASMRERGRPVELAR
jgi:predicted dehydrogenase